MYSIEIINEYMAGKEAVSEKSPSLIHSLSARSRISAESRMSGAQMRLKETLLQKMRLHSFSVMVQRQGSILISTENDTDRIIIIIPQQGSASITGLFAGIPVDPDT